MKVMVIGGTSHVGSFMVPMLIDAGCEVVVVGAGRTAIPKGKNWNKIKYLKCNITDENAGDQLRAENPNVVINMPGRTYHVYQMLKAKAQHIIACGSLWMLGEPNMVPTPEQTQAPCPFEDYAERYDYIQKMLRKSRKDGIAFTAIFPPNICGPGKIPLECLGGRDIEVHKQHAAGQEVILPDGPEVLIGPCDAEDIASCFVRAALNPEKANAQIFNVGSDYALVASKFVAAYADIYGTEIPIKNVTWQEYTEKVSPDIGCWWHFKAHMCPDISKAKSLLGYQPQYTPEQTLARAVEWMRKQDII